MKRHRPTLVLGTIALVVLGIGFAWWHDDTEPDAGRSISNDVPGDVNHAAVLEVAPPPAVAASQTGTDRRSLVGMGMTTQEPLAFVTRLRDQGGPGAFAAAEQVTTACREALGALDYFNDPSNGPEIAQQLAKAGVNAGRFQSAQSQAAQSLEARCRPFEIPLESDEPKADDASGAAYVDARAKLAKSLKGGAESLQELSRQGQLQSATEALRGRYRMKGEPGTSAEDREILMRGMTLASFRASTDLANQASDLRVMTSCLRIGVCDGSYESVMLQYWPEGTAQRARTLAIAQKLEKAFASNDAGMLGGR